MKYFTKEWYSNMKNMDLSLSLRISFKANKFDEKYYENLYKKELKKFLKEEKEFRQSILEEYDEKKLTNLFEENHLDKIEHLKKALPDDILSEIADIRVLALDKSSRSVKDKIKRYCNKNEKNVNNVMENYYSYFQKIEDTLPDKIIENYELHDCKILDIHKENNNIIFDIDSSGGFRDINKVIYKDGEILENNLIEGSYWLFDEIYVLKDGYEFRIGGSPTGYLEYAYMVIRAKDVDFK